MPVLSHTHTTQVVTHVTLVSHTHTTQDCDKQIQDLQTQLDQQTLQVRLVSLPTVQC